MSAQPRQRPRSLIELHYQVDDRFRMIGALAQDPNFRRDVHDIFNLIALVPIVVLNAMNWRWELLIDNQWTVPSDLWHGQSFELFWWSTLAYFIVDLLWVVSVSGSVRSPSVIVVHHCITLVYLMVPRLHPSLGWCMGACMSVELNTWFLIARRIFNKSGINPFMPSGELGEIAGMKIKATSIGFYLTWIPIRLVLYPSLVIPFLREYMTTSEELGTWLNPVMLAPIFQIILTVLNLKWSLDLVRSKLKGKGPEKGL
uniref:TLC domain-containing protein n=1 Tax=Pinguiococcus pyrenoidosus TaxID=172671 RepID=A0A7R9YC30_9STRA|mmetsp:Transcript_17340/g.66077  ORF Transcript_17340/g.66077 Transcript_17340/m.66077 type:complete len:257 (+) Transcript_17340:50-820(+)